MENNSVYDLIFIWKIIGDILLHLGLPWKTGLLWTKQDPEKLKTPEQINPPSMYYCIPPNSRLMNNTMELMVKWINEIYTDNITLVPRNI